MKAPSDGTGTLVLAGPPARLTRPASMIVPSPVSAWPPASTPPAETPPAETAGAPRGTGAEQPRQASGWLLPLAVLVTGMFMSILDTSIVNIALTNIRRDFGATIESAQWISTAYALTEGAVVPVSAWLGTRLGHKRLYVISIAMFTVFSALCGISGSITEMVIFRIGQAVFGGMIPVTCVTLIYRMVPREKIGTAMGLFGVGVVVAPGIGPTLGGYFVEHLSWHYIYWVNVPIGIFATFAAMRILRTEPKERTEPFDTWGFVCIAVGLFALLLALEEGSSWGWSSYPVLGLFALASNMLMLWVVIELQVEHPLLDVRVFLNRTFLTSVVLVAVMFVGLSVMVFYLPLFLQGVQGYTPSYSGLILLPQAVVLVICMPLAGRLFDAIGARWPALVGTLLIGIGMLMLAQLNTDITVHELVVAECVVAAGLGIGMMPVQTGALTALRGRFGESGNSFNTLSQRVSQAFGVALLTAMVSVDREQFFADRSSLVDARGANADPRITQMSQQGSGGLLSLWQEYTNQAQTMAYGKAFLIVGCLALAAAALAFLLPTGRPTATDGEKPVVH